MNSDPLRLPRQRESRLAGKVLTWVACGALFFSTLGCQPGDLARIAVSGAVTSESGEPISGTISFLPKPGTEGPAATASLVDGAFSFQRENGPVAGEYRVLVVRSAAEQKHRGISASSGTDEPPGDRLSPDQEWSFEVIVSAENFEFDFEVPDDREAEPNRGSATHNW